jgi:uncharacterized repeat protein (TIGR01451 family)
MSNTITGYGGLTGSDQILTLTTDGGGEILYSFDMYTIPDRFIVSYAGTVLVDTGYVSNTRSGAIAIPDDSSNQVSIVVLSSTLNTLWAYTVTSVPQFPTAPLSVTIIGNGAWSAPNQQGIVSYTGSVDVSYGGGPSVMEVENATVTIKNGSVAFSAGAVAITSQGTLFSGAFDIVDSTGLLQGISGTQSSFDFGMALFAASAQLQYSDVALAATVALPGWLQPVLVTTTLPSGQSSLLVSPSGVQFGALGSLAAQTASVNFFNDFSANLTNLVIGTVPGGSAVTLDGSLTTTAPFAAGGSIDLGFAAANDYLEISASGSITLVGSLAASSDWIIAPGFELDDVGLQIDPNSGAVTGNGTFKLSLGDTGSSVSVGTTLGFTTNPWLLDPIAVNDTIAAGLAIGGTPFLLSGLTGEVGNVALGATSAVDFNGTFDLTIGTAGETVAPLQIAAVGTYLAGEGFSAAITGGLGVSGTSTLASLSGTGSIDWDYGSLEGTLGISVLSGLFAGTVGLAADQLGFELYGTGTADLPSVGTINGVDLTIPSIVGGGSSISGATLSGYYVAGGSLADDSLNLGWTQSFTLSDSLGNLSTVAETVGINLPFSGTPALLGVAAAASGGQVQAGGAISYSATYAVPSYTGLLVLTASYSTIGGGTAALNVIEPGGNIVPSSGFDAAGILEVPALDAPGTQAVAIVDPVAGDWQLEVSNADTVGAVTFTSTTFAAAPALTLSQPVADGTGWSFSWQITDPPAGATITFYAQSSSGTYVGVPISAPLPATGTGSFVWDGSSVAPGAYAVFAMLSGGADASAEATAPGGDVSVVAPTDLALSLTGPTGAVTYGSGDITLDLTVVNSGTAAANNAVVDVTIPVGFTPDVSQTTLVRNGAGWDIPIGTIAAGQTVTDPLLLAQTGSTMSGLATFDASVNSDGANPAGSAVGAASLAITVVGSAVTGFDLVPSHIDIGQTAAPGGTLTYELELNNSGNAEADDYSMTETVGGAQILGASVLAGSTDPSVSVGLDSLNNILAVTGNALAAGGEVLVGVTVQAFGATEVIGTEQVATATGNALVPYGAPQVDVVGSGSTQIQAPADIGVSILSGASTVSLGGSLAFTVTVSNSGPNLSSGVEVSVPLSGAFTPTSASTVQGSYNLTSGLWTIGNLASGASRTLTIYATATSMGVQAVTASVAAQDESDPNLANNTATTDVSVACFASATRIAMEVGEMPVETIRKGMVVQTARGTKAAVTWVGFRRCRCAAHPRPTDIWPVRVRKDAFGAELPRRDLLLSPDHAVYMSGVLIPIRALINGISILQEKTDEITYWHVELAEHDVLLAEGLPCESYLDTGNRASFANAGTVVKLHPDFAHYVWESNGCAPLIASGAYLIAARQRLLDIARGSGRLADAGGGPNAA